MEGATGRATAAEAGGTGAEGTREDEENASSVERQLRESSSREISGGRICGGAEEVEDADDEHTFGVDGSEEAEEADEEKEEEGKVFGLRNGEN